MLGEYDYKFAFVPPPIIYCTLHSKADYYVCKILNVALN